MIRQKRRSEMDRKRGLAAGIVFLVGCVVGGGAGHLFVSAASAEQVAPTRWEYKCIVSIAMHKVEATANELGEERWEMAAGGTSVLGMSGYSTYCFKRPKR
jgi:hypothetical protein